MLILLFIISVFIGFLIGFIKNKKSQQNLLNYYVRQQEIKKLQNMRVNSHQKTVDMDNIVKDINRTLS